jgi:hypothetical protein
MFLFCALWCTLWSFIFSYGLPAGGMAAMLEVMSIPPAVLVLLAGLRLAVTGKRVISGGAANFE